MALDAFRCFTYEHFARPFSTLGAMNRLPNGRIIWKIWDMVEIHSFSIFFFMQLSFFCWGMLVDMHVNEGRLLIAMGKLKPNEN